jgi:hypothetical protein
MVTCIPALTTLFPYKKSAAAHALSFILKVEMYIAPAGI